MASTDTQDESNKWQCPNCTFANHPAINVCEMCQLPKSVTRRPSFLRTPPSSCYCHPRESTLPIQSWYLVFRIFRYVLFPHLGCEIIFQLVKYTNYFLLCSVLKELFIFLNHKIFCLLLTKMYVVVADSSSQSSKSYFHLKSLIILYVKMFHCCHIAY